MSLPLIAFGYLSLLATGAIFGFFYAWVCSMMWGLDAAGSSRVRHSRINHFVWSIGMGAAKSSDR